MRFLTGITGAAKACVATNMGLPTWQRCGRFILLGRLKPRIESRLQSYRAAVVDCRQSLAAICKLSWTRPRRLGFGNADHCGSARTLRSRGAEHMWARTVRQ